MVFCRISNVEDQIGGGLIEEVIQVAEGELQLVDTMLQSKVFVSAYPMQKYSRPVAQCANAGIDGKSSTKSHYQVNGTISLEINIPLARRHPLTNRIIQDLHAVMYHVLQVPLVLILSIHFSCIR